jgi:hypothetical protein
MSSIFFGQGAPSFNFAGKYLPALEGKKKPAFSPETPQQFLEDKRNLERQGYAPEDVNAAMQQFAPSTSSRTPEGQLVEGLVPLMQKQVEQNIFLGSPEGMEMQLAMARKDAKEKAQQGLMFSTLAKLPESIAMAASPFGGPVGAAMFYQGMSQIPQIYSNTLASFPQIQAPGSSTQQYRYFN